MLKINENRRLRMVPLGAISKQYPQAAIDYGTADSWVVLDLADDQRLNDGTRCTKIIAVFPDEHHAAVMVTASPALYPGWGVIQLMIHVYHKGKLLIVQPTVRVSVRMGRDHFVTQSKAFFKSSIRNKVYCELGHPGMTYGKSPSTDRYRLTPEGKSIGYIGGVNLSDTKVSVGYPTIVNIILTDDNWINAIRQEKLIFSIRGIINKDPNMGIYLNNLITCDLTTSPREANNGSK